MTERAGEGSSVSTTEARGGGLRAGTAAGGSGDRAALPICKMETRGGGLRWLPAGGRVHVRAKGGSAESAPVVNGETSRCWPRTAPVGCAVGDSDPMSLDVAGGAPRPSPSGDST